MRFSIFPFKKISHPIIITKLNGINPNLSTLSSIIFENGLLTVIRLEPAAAKRFTGRSGFLEDLSGRLFDIQTSGLHHYLYSALNVFAGLVSAAFID